VVITSYNVLAGDAILRNHRWHRIILDEAHVIKSHKTKMATSCFALQATYRWCLTGTPIQNGAKDLFSYFKFLKAYPLNDYGTFNTRILKNVKDNKNIKTTVNRIQSVLKALLLRRTKATIVNGKPIIELPEKHVEHLRLEFSPNERKLYDTMSSSVQTRVKEMIKQAPEGRQAIEFLALLTRLRQICCHPKLVEHALEVEDVKHLFDKADEEQQDDAAADDLIKQLEAMNLSSTACLMCGKLGVEDVCADCTSTKTKISSLASTKVKMLMERLRDICANHPRDKVIVFSQWTSLLSLVEVELGASGMTYCQFNGSMNAKQRDTMLTTFRTDPKTNLMLVSLKAGNVGLNLTVANRVFLLDVW
jgi:SNF2 family DNA or RNA helicase